MTKVSLKLTGLSRALEKLLHGRLIFSAKVSRSMHSVNFPTKRRHWYLRPGAPRRVFHGIQALHYVIDSTLSPIVPDRKTPQVFL